VLTKNQVDYLRSLVRMDIRKRERALAAFKPREGQPLEEAEQIRAKQAEVLAFKREVHDALCAMKGLASSA
jgi:hypothetical protein